MSIYKAERKKMNEIFKRSSLIANTKPKTRNEKNRKRNVIVNFRMSPEEKESLKSYFGDNHRYADNKEKLYELVDNEPYYRAMDEDAYEVVSMYTNSTELVRIEEHCGKDGKRDMCQAIKDLMADSREEGKEIGMELAKLESARNLIGLLSDEVIAEKIGLSLEKVIELHE